MEEKIIGSIKTAKIQEKFGCVIIFITDDNVIKEDNVMINFEEHYHYFEVKDIEITDDNKLLVEAYEVGYWATKFDKNEEFDLRSLTDISVALIKDRVTLSKINDMSCWC
jgi:hypothetical protein